MISLLLIYVYCVRLAVMEMLDQKLEQQRKLVGNF